MSVADSSSRFLPACRPSAPARSTRRPLRRRPDELSPVEPLRIQRQPEAIVPEDLRQIALAPAEDVEIAAVRVALQLLLDLKRQTCMPRHMLVWPVAIHTRTPLGIRIIVRPERPEP